MNTPPPRSSNEYYHNTFIPASSSDSDYSRGRRKKHLDHSISPTSLRSFEECPESYLSSKDVDRQRRLDQERTARKEIEKVIKALDDSDWLFLNGNVSYQHRYPQL